MQINEEQLKKFILESGLVTRSDFDLAVKKSEAKKQKFTISLKRFKTKKKENFFEIIANAQILNLDKNINQGKEAKEDLGKALKFLDDYSYNADEIVMPTVIFNGGWSSTGTF